MENTNYNPQIIGSQDVAGDKTKTFIASVFSWMGVALAITAVVSYLFGTNPSYMRMLVNTETGGLSGLGYITMFAPIGFVLAMSLGWTRWSSSVILVLFLAYAVVMGMSLSFIFLMYTDAAIFGTFFTTAAMFGVMSLLGYTTKTDLTKLGSLLIMALIGMVIASIVNMFLRSDGMSYMISFIGVIVFTGLTAYDVQKLKRIGEGVEYGTDTTAKLSMMGALNLYLDFINLFLFLLRLFGGRRS
ncbi:MAG: Bax inhibitor-1/YccA family protein [Bacteroidota bacterium]